MITQQNYHVPKQLTSNTQEPSHTWAFTRTKIYHTVQTTQIQAQVSFPMRNCNKQSIYWKRKKLLNIFLRVSTHNESISLLHSIFVLLYRYFAWQSEKSEELFPMIGKGIGPGGYLYFCRIGLQNSKTKRTNARKNVNTLLQHRTSVTS